MERLLQQALLMERRHALLEDVLLKKAIELQQERQCVRCGRGMGKSVAKFKLLLHEMLLSRSRLKTQTKRAGTCQMAKGLLLTP